MKWARWILSLIALGIMLYLFWPLLAELHSAADLFRSFQWGWLLLPLSVQTLSYVFLVWLNQLSLQPFPGKIKSLPLAGTLTAVAFIETAIPSAGASGVALRAHLLGKHGQYEVEASTFSLFLETVFLGVAMSTVGFLGLEYLASHGELSLTRITQLLILGIGIISIFWGVWSILRNEQRTRALIQKFIGIWSWLILRLHLSSKLPRPTSQSVESRIKQFHLNLAKIKYLPIWKFGLAAYGRVVFDMATLGSCFLIFKHPIQSDVLLTGYGLIILLSGLAALPGGMLVADVSVPVIFSRLGTPIAIALAAGLIYRLVAFWLLRFIGFLNWQILEVKSQ